jgi:hypothetical protein
MQPDAVQPGIEATSETASHSEWDKDRLLGPKSFRPTRQAARLRIIPTVAPMAWTAIEPDVAADNRILDLWKGKLARG